MAVDLETSIRIDADLVQTARAALHDTFGDGFTIWAYTASSWYAVSPDGLAHQTDQSMADLGVSQLLEQARTTKTPALREADTAFELAVPVSLRPRVPLVAIGRVADVPADQLLRFAALFQHDVELREEVVTLRHENQAFLRQVTNDFEELTFLRSMAELLEISDLSFDFIAMTETVLPTLKPLLEADELVLVGSRDIGSREQPEFAVGDVVARTRQPVVEDGVCRELVERYRSQCEHQAVVRNHFSHAVDGQELPGVNSFILVPITNADRHIGWLLALNRNNERNINVEELPWEVSYLEFGTHEATLMSSSAAILATHSRNVDLFGEREELLVGMIRALVSAIEAKDEYTRGHSERVALYGKRLAEEMGLSDEYCQRLYLTGLLHDVGKIGVRDAVLRKPGPLTDDEFEEIKEHPDKGWAILQDLDALGYVLPGVLHHHENYDGGGYPDQLAGEDIPLDGRILAVADAFDAMTSDRPYRAGMSQQKAAAILRNGAGGQFDPDAVDAFFRVVPDLLHIKATYTPRRPPQRKQPHLV